MWTLVDTEKTSMWLTYNHECELEALLDWLSVDLVGEVGESHVTRLFRVDKLKHRKAGTQINTPAMKSIKCYCIPLPHQMFLRNGRQCSANMTNTSVMCRWDSNIWTKCQRTDSKRMDIHSYKRHGRDMERHAVCAYAKELSIFWYSTPWRTRVHDGQWMRVIVSTMTANK